MWPNPEETADFLCSDDYFKYEFDHAFRFRFDYFYVANLWKFCIKLILNRGNGHLLLYPTTIYPYGGCKGLSKVPCGSNVRLS